ncbi:transcriptional regulator [Sulfolobus acidocaldarius SUSAZ]|nr:transcriptional regulator [Sulfolobus acidocaldarius SUSAZ]
MKRDILNGKYKPGETIVASQLAKDLGVSRNTLRVALSFLEKDGLIIVENSKFKVRKLTLEETVEILDIRELLEGYTARIAAQRITEEELKKLEDILNKMRESLEKRDYDSYTRLNDEFHITIYNASRTKIASQLLSEIKMRILRYQYRTILLPARGDESIKEHEAIYNALKSHSPDQAETEAKRHVSKVREAIILNKRFLDLDFS